VPPTADLLGDTGAASAAFQLTATLAAGEEEPGRIAVLTSVDVDGVVVAAVLRLGDGTVRGAVRGAVQGSVRDSVRGATLSATRGTY